MKRHVKDENTEAETLFSQTKTERSQNFTKVQKKSSRLLSCRTK